MPLKECQNKHLYNGDKHGDTCPICGLTEKQAKTQDKSLEELESMLKLALENYVCGWLVCIEGLNKGRSYPLHSGKNFMGSGDDMDVQILGDRKVNLWRHGVITFDSQKQEAMLLPGESAGIVYLEGSALFKPQALAPYARIEMGDTKLIFMPFCGEQFSWSE